MTDTCPLCHGDLRESVAALSRPVGDRHVTVVGVPVQRCENCGEEWFQGRVLKRVEALALRSGGLGEVAYSVPPEVPAGAANLISGGADDPARAADLYKMVEKAFNHTPFIVAEAANAYIGHFDKLMTSDQESCYRLRFADGTLVPYAPDRGMRVTINRLPGFGETDLRPGDECLVSLGAEGLARYVAATRLDLEARQVREVLPEAKGRPGKLSIVDGSVVEVPAGAAVTINGRLAVLRDLLVGDMVDVATYGAFGTRAIEVRARRD